MKRKREGERQKGIGGGRWREEEKEGRDRSEGGRKEKERMEGGRKEKERMEGGRREDRSCTQYTLVLYTLHTYL